MDAALFLAVVVGCGILSVFVRSAPMTRTCLTLLACWFVGIAWREWIEPANQWPWLLYAIVDIIGAAIIIRHPAGRLQGFIGLCFLVQFAMNIGYGANYLQHGYSYDAQLLAWEANTRIGNLKLLFLGGWAGGWLVGLGGGRTSLLRRRKADYLRAGEAR